MKFTRMLQVIRTKKSTVYSVQEVGYEPTGQALELFGEVVERDMIFEDATEAALRCAQLNKSCNRKSCKAD